MVGKFKRRYERFRNNALFAELQVTELPELGSPDYDGMFDRLTIGHAQPLTKALLAKAIDVRDGEHTAYIFCIGDATTQVTVRPHQDNEVEFAVRP